MADQTGNNGSYMRGMITRWTSERQPPNDSKSRGWLKKKRAKELLHAILERNFDPKNLSGAMRKQLADFYDVDPEEISNEAALYFVQITQGIAKGDTAAFNSVMDRAYGKPKEVVEVKTPEAAMNQLSDEQLLAQLNELTSKLNGQNSTGTSHTNGTGTTTPSVQGGI